MSLVISLEASRIAEDFEKNSHHLAKHQSCLQIRRGCSPLAVESEGSRFSALSTQRPPVQFHDSSLFLLESWLQRKRVEAEPVLFLTVTDTVQWDPGLDPLYIVHPEALGDESLLKAAMEGLWLSYCALTWQLASPSQSSSLVNVSNAVNKSQVPPHNDQCSYTVQVPQPSYSVPLPTHHLNFK